MRWKLWVAGLTLVVAGLTGCTQQCFITEADRDHYQRLMPANLEYKPEDALPVVPGTPVPSNVNEPERKPRYLSLAEAIAMGLESGITGILSVRQSGSVTDDLGAIQDQQGILSRSDAVRVLALQPAFDGSNIEAELARFDVNWVSGVRWATNDQPIQGLGSFNVGENAYLENSLYKPLATGGVAGITFQTNYQNLRFPPNNFQLQNPSYTPRLAFTFDHPLFQGFGTEINEIETRQPFIGTFTGLSQIALSSFNFRSTGGGLNGPQGILISRVRFDQSRADFERNIAYQLLNIETAYWNLYGAYVNLYAAEQAMYQAYEVWRLTKIRYDIGKDPLTDYAQVRGQYEQFRGDRIAALGRVLEFERILRRLVGLPPEDGCQLIPIDSPTLAPYYPDWCSALKEAIELRPELAGFREELHARQLVVLRQLNRLKPDVRFSAQYGLNGLGSRLDGNNPLPNAAATGEADRTTNALRELASNRFTDWQIGLVMNMPLGYRQEHAQLRQAKLQLAQMYMSLKNEEKRAESYLAKAYRDLFETHKLIEARRAQREAYGDQVRARFEQYKAGLQDPKQKTPVDFLLEAQRQWANALSQEYQQVVNYNNALASFQFAKGTILHHDNVVIGEGLLPQCAAVRAVDHERERSKSLLLRERAHPVKHTPVADDEHSPMLPDMSSPVAPSVVALKEGAPPLLEALDKLDIPARMSTTPSPRQPASSSAPVTIPVVEEDQGVLKTSGTTLGIGGVPVSRPAAAPRPTFPPVKTSEAVPISSLPPTTTNTTASAVSTSHWPR